MRLRSSMPRIVSGENSSIPDMFHCLFAPDTCPGLMPAMFCETVTIYAVRGRGKAGIPLPVQFVISWADDSQRHTSRRSTILRTATDHGQRSSAAVEAGQRRLRQGVKVQIEADQRSRSRIAGGIRQLVDVNRKNRDLIMMRLVACRRTRPTISTAAEIGAALDRPLRHQLLRHIASPLGQGRRGGWNVEHNPVPPAAAGRRIRIIDTD